MKPILFLLLVLFSFDSFSQTTVISELEADSTGNRFLRIIHGDRFFDVLGENYTFSHTEYSKGPKKLSLEFIKNSGKVQERKDFWIEDGEYRLTGKVNDESTWEVYPNHPYNQIDQEIESADLETRKKLIFQQLENELGQEKLIKFATRIPAFMYLTDFRENTLQDVITKLEPDLFLAVTGLTVKDFHLLVRLRVFNTEQMNQAVFAFRRYEDASLRYTGIESHKGLTHYGLYDTVVARDE